MPTLRFSGALASIGALLASSHLGMAWGQTFTPAEGDPLISYTSIADSPFFGDGVACYALETFPDGAAGVGGWSFASGASIVEVEPGQWALQQNSVGVITLSFQPDDDGNYPTRVGFAWTGGISEGSSLLRLDVISGGTQSSSRTFTDLPPNPPTDPDSNLFFGVEWATGLQQVRITFNPFVGVPNQIDDLQFSVSQNVTGISTESASFAPAGGPGSFGVDSLASACTWTAETADEWITLDVSSGSGDANVQYTVAENVDAVARTGSISVGSFTHTVVQSPAGCAVVSLDPTEATPGAGGGAAFFTVATNGPECFWSAETSEDWITLTTASGTGDGPVDYTVAENATTSERIGTISVEGLVFTVTQAAAVCAVTGLDPVEASFESAGGPASFGVFTNGPECTWTATSAEDWIVIDAGSESGTGDGTVAYTVAENTGKVVRTGTIAVGGLVHTITQAAPCAVLALDPTDATPDAAGGGASFAVDMNGETCPWTAVVEEGIDWVTIDAGSESGTGDGTVAYAVAVNAANVERTATITVSDLTFSIVQSAAGCAVSALDPSAADFEAAGGSATFGVDMNGETCPWTATTAEDWITIDVASGTGDGDVEYTVAINSDPVSRVGTITVEGVDFAVTQAAGCSVTFINPASVELDATAQPSSFTVATSTGDCTWSASTDTEWITLDVASGIGIGDVVFSVTENTGAEDRTGTIEIAGFATAFTVTQAGVPCEVLALTPDAETFDSTGGTGEFTVDVSDEICEWTASTSDLWITLDTITGTGDGPVNYTVSEYFGADDRTGTISVEGVEFTVTQTADCSVTAIDPTSTDADTDGGDFTFAVTVGGKTCEWVASTDEDWITITTGEGVGDGEVAFTVAANDTTEERTGAVTVGGLDHTVTQAAGGCGVASVSPTGADFSASGGGSTFAVTVNGQNCEWSASTDEDWITVGTTSGTGDGNVAYTVSANTSPKSRSGTITVEIPGVEGTDDERTFQIDQAAACAVTSVDPETAEFTETGGSGSFSVVVDNQDCDWTATTDDDWITLSTSTGTGDGTVDYVVAFNPEASPRTGRISVGGQIHTVTQQASCAVVDLNPAEATIDATGGSGSVSVVVSRPDCEWTAETDADWITLENASGTGAGTFDYTVGEYDGVAERTGVVTVGEKTFTLTQSSSCNVTLDPTEASFEPAGGSGSIAVTTSLESCEWSASTEDDWITITTASGTGDGTVDYEVAVWAGPDDRVGNITVGGVDFRITQTAACSIVSVSPDPGTYPPSGGSGNFTVTTSTPECAWTVESDAEWLTLDPTSGVGTGKVAFTVPSYSGPVARTATVTVGGISITIDQSAFCSIESIDPTSDNFTEDGGTGTISVVTDGATCEWTATTDADWVTLDVSSGTGDGTVEYTVAVNETAEQRQAVIEIGGLQFDVLQGTAGCVVENLAPATADYTAAGGNGSFSITLNDGTCTWTATSNAAWITVETASGSGSGVVSYSVAENGGITQREGTITVLGETHTVVQAPGDCMATAIDPETATFSIAGGDGLFGVTLNDESCEWTTESSAAWVVVEEPSGTGSGSIAYTVAENTTGQQRSATITVAGLTHQVDQAGENETYVFNPDESYESLPDSPFFGTGQSCFELEFFPGGALSVPGLSFNAGAAAIVPGTGVAPGTHVLRSSGDGVIRLSLDAETVSGGQLPTAFGFVWTGGNATSITLTPTSGSGIVSDSRTFTDLGPNSSTVSSDNRFFGVEWDERIRDVEIVFDPPSAAYQIDQIQFAIAPAECDTGEPDFNGDGWNDMVVQNLINGQIQIQLLLDGEGAGLLPTGQSIIPQFYADAIGSFGGGGSGRPSIAWRNVFTGLTSGWRMNGGLFSQQYAIQPTVSTDWVLVGSGDLNEDGVDDLVWQNDVNARIGYWTMGANGQPTSYNLFPRQTNINWELVGVGDFNDDGRPDLLWRNLVNDRMGVWYLDENLGIGSIGLLTSDAPDSYSSIVAGVADYNNDGVADILWQVGFNTLQLWFMQRDPETGELSRELVTPDLDVDDFDLWRVRGG
jgi:hypothetical protein